MKGRCGECKEFPGKGGQVCKHQTEEKKREKVYALDYQCKGVELK